MAEPEHEPCIAIVWFDLLRKLAPPVVVYRQGNQKILINIATKDWLSCDLVIACAQRFAERSQNDLKAVYDPKSLLNTLRIAPKPPTTDETRLTALVQEFLRILGLLPAGIKRGALYTVQFGLGILRDHVAQFLTEAAGLTGRTKPVARLIVKRYVAAQQLANRQQVCAAADRG